MIEIPSTYVNERSQGHGPVSVVEPGSDKWKAIVQSLKADTAEPKPPERKTYRVLVGDSHCLFCDRDFTFNLRESSASASVRVYCSDECCTAHRRVQKGCCPGCHKDFEGFGYDTRFCAEKCYRKWHYRQRRCLTCDRKVPKGEVFCDSACEKNFKRHRTCKNCGVPFGGLGRGWSRRQHCSKECSVDYRNKKRTRKRRMSHGEVACALDGCDTVFLPKKGRTYCSIECRRESKRRQNRAQRGATEVVFEVQDVTCAQCRKVFTPTPQHRKTALYCSRECGQEALREERYQERVAAWSNLTCKLCGCSFAATPVPNKKPPSWCSPECVEDNNQINAIRHRARSRRNYREAQRRDNGLGTTDSIGVRDGMVPGTPEDVPTGR